MKILVVGITGQDGALLADYMLKKGHTVYGTYRRASTPNFWRLQSLGVFEDVNLIPMELIDESSAVEAIKTSWPDQVYFLAAQSFVGASFEQPIGTGEITGIGALRMLEAIRQVKPDTKYYNAASSEMFGEELDGMQNELTPFSPVSPYAAAKLYGYHMTKIYRKAYDLFACNGILFNHESQIRGLEFISRKVTNAVAKIYHGLMDYLYIGNLESKRDWGYAPDYIEAMDLMLAQNKPEDFIIATGKSHSVTELIKIAFECAELDWTKYVKQKQAFMRPLDVMYHKGDASKACSVLGWSPKVQFKEMIELMTKTDIDRWSRYLAGERFAWDAQNYPDESRILTKMARLER